MGLQSYYTWTDSEIRGHNGTLFIFKGLWRNPETVKSLEGTDIVWIEEAQAISQASLRTLTPTVRKPGSEIWFSWNPRNRDDPVDVMFRGPDGPPPNSIVVNVTYRNNPWLSDELKAEIEWDKRHDLDKYNHVWLGDISYAPKRACSATGASGRWRSSNSIARPVMPSLASRRSRLIISAPIGATRLIRQMGANS